MHIDFTLPQSCGKSKWLKPTDKKHQLHVAKKIAELHYGELHQHLPPVFQNKNRQILIHPHTNNHWLVLPGNDGLNKNQWRL